LAQHTLENLKIFWMKTVKLIPERQNGENVIIVSFYANETLENHLMQLKEVKRDNSNGKFYIKNTGQNLSLVFNHMRKIKCYVDYTELKQKPLVGI
jgi:integrase/recombinase XerD